MTLEPGLERTDEFTAEGRLLTDVRGTLPAPEGSTCTVTAKLREVEDGRKLRFDVEVRDGERTIGVGTHERRVIDRAGFG
jgi:predicted thioesterase